jgi:hypothetical protein
MTELDYKTLYLEQCKLTESLQKSNDILKADANHNYKQLYEESLVTIDAMHTYFAATRYRTDWLRTYFIKARETIGDLSAEFDRVTVNQDKYADLLESHGMDLKVDDTKTPTLNCKCGYAYDCPECSRKAYEYRIRTTRKEFMDQASEPAPKPAKRSRKKNKS